LAGKSKRRGRNQWWQLIAFLMRTFHLSIGQIAQMDLVQIYAIVEGYMALSQGGTKTPDEIWEEIQRLR